MDINFNLYKELVKNFHLSDKNTKDRLALIERVAGSMNGGAIKRMLQSWVIILFEIIVWSLVVIAILAIIFTDKVYPFSLLYKLSFSSNMPLETIGETNSDMLYLGMKGLFALIAILLFIIGRLLSSIRRKNKILGLASKNMKKIGEMTLKEKSNIEMLYTRYPFDLPKTQDSIIIGNNGGEQADISNIQPPKGDELL